MTSGPNRSSASRIVPNTSNDLRRPAGERCERRRRAAAARRARGRASGAFDAVELGVGRVRARPEPVDERGPPWWWASACSRTSMRRQVQPHRARRAHEVGDATVGDEVAVVLAERAAQQFEIGHQLRRSRGSRRRVRAVRRPRQPSPGARQLGPDARDLQPVRLLGVDATEPSVDLGQALEVLRQGVEQLLGHAADARRDAELLDERLQRIARRP